MKNIYFSHKFLFVLGYHFFLSATAFCQVGINTTNPRTTLEVAGDMHINGQLDIRNINSLQDGNSSSFLTQSSDGLIKELNAQNGDGLVIAYFQEYTLKNMLGDWVAEFNTNIPADKYVLTIISTYFNQEMVMDGSQKENFSLPYCSAYIGGNPSTWRIVADYPGAAPSSGAEGEWVISTMILLKEFSKILPQQDISMQGNRGGVNNGSPILN